MIWRKGIGSSTLPFSTKQKQEVVKIMSDEEEVKLNLVQKLAKIREMSDAVARSKSGYGYKYADITEILAKVTAGMKKYRVSLIPEIVPGTFVVETVRNEKTKKAKDGTPYVEVSTETMVNAQMLFKWVNDEDVHDKIVVPWHLVGSQSDPSQAMGSALTYCTRYFLIEYFQIATPDNDVDAYRSKQKEAEEREEKELVEAMIAEIDTAVLSYLEEHADKRDEVKEFIGRYVKGSNYKKIKDSNTAGLLLKEFKATFMSEAVTVAAEEPTEEAKGKGGK